MGSLQSLQIASAETGTIRAQFAALCWQPHGAEIDVLLITSRDTGRWIIPKGWPMPGLAPEAVAEQEAWEEAGAEGEVSSFRIGRYGYFKTFAPDSRMPCAVSVYGLRVRSLADTYPEVKERRRAWFAQDVAAGLVDEPDLASLIAGFVPPVIGRHPVISGEA
ncbi:MAG: hypothetical protein B7Z31_04085 [Rhodobacterales bacterium 12-65-15]|nr:MAG: hypothetical protein B7Z31_04085 [Rhodobacterales bacterium 12-65-15]